MNTLRIISLLVVPLITLSACESSDNSENSQTLRLSEITNNWSGGLVEITNIEYNESGHLLREIISADGEIVLTRNYETTADGQLVRRSDDIDQDGVEDRSSTYEYMDGLGLIRTNRIGPSMLIESIDVFQFEDGHAVSAEIRDIVDVATSDLVDESSGTVTARYNFAYEDNRLIEKTSDSNNDGVVDEVEVFSYNPNGTLASSSNSSVTSGVIYSATFVYEQGKCNTNVANSVSYYRCVNTK